MTKRRRIVASSVGDVGGVSKIVGLFDLMLLLFLGAKNVGVAALTIKGITTGALIGVSVAGFIFLPIGVVDRWGALWGHQGFPPFNVAVLY